MFTNSVLTYQSRKQLTNYSIITLFCFMERFLRYLSVIKVIELSQQMVTAAVLQISFLIYIIKENFNCSIISDRRMLLGVTSGH